jgi:hypothetical protein
MKHRCGARLINSDFKCERLASVVFIYSTVRGLGGRVRYLCFACADRETDWFDFCECVPMNINDPFTWDKINEAS